MLHSAPPKPCYSSVQFAKGTKDDDDDGGGEKTHPSSKIGTTCVCHVAVFVHGMSWREHSGPQTTFAYLSMSALPPFLLNLRRKKRVGHSFQDRTGTHTVTWSIKQIISILLLQP